MSSSVTVQPKLESSGAGLPAFELAWLRILFRYACRVISLNAGLKWFKFEARRLVVLTGKVSTTQATVPVLIDRVVGLEDSSRYWSVFLVLDHLRIVDEGISQIMTTLTDDRLFGQEVRIQALKPSPQSDSDTVSRFLKAVDDYEVTVTRLGILGRRVRHPHPWFGPMTAHEWHFLAAIHHRVHRRQLERIVRKLIKETRAHES